MPAGTGGPSGQTHKQCFICTLISEPIGKLKKKGDEKPKYHLYTHKADIESRPYVCGRAGFITMS